MCAAFVVYVRSIESLVETFVEACYVPPKESLKHSKEYFVSGCLKQDKVPENGGFSYL